MSKIARHNAVALEELFYDQLEFKIRSLLKLYTFERDHEAELNRILDGLRRRTHATLELIHRHR